MSRLHIDQERVQFNKDVDRHKLHVFRDDGVYRHLRLHRPGNGGCMHFDLITWPGYLCYTGDMGTFVFTRTQDMFEFFRRPLDKRIDYRYWAEKCEGADKGAGVQEFDAEAFRAALKREGLRIVRSGRARKHLSKEERRELWEQLHSEVLGEMDERHDQVAFSKAYEFSYSKGSYFDPDRLSFRLELEDFPSCRRWTHRFLWCCHAMAWGIAQYDAHRCALADPMPA